jgi:nicotinamidase/pyrazinamidase
MRYRIDTKMDALLVVHVQRDFCAGGSLPVPGGDEVVPVLNQWLAVPGLLKIATRDWHPANHCSFKAQGGPWPPHCVQGSLGGQFHPDLRTVGAAAVISTATDPAREAYSGFDAPALLETLRRHQVRRLWVGGLATEYCVKETVLAALTHGFEVFVIEDAIRGIEAQAGDCDAARHQMQQAGAVFVSTADVLRS